MPCFLLADGLNLHSTLCTIKGQLALDVSVSFVLFVVNERALCQDEIPLFPIRSLMALLPEDPTLQHALIRSSNLVSEQSTGTNTCA